MTDVLVHDEKFTIEGRVDPFGQQYLTAKGTQESGQQLEYLHEDSSNGNVYDVRREEERFPGIGKSVTAKASLAF